MDRIKGLNAKHRVLARQHLKFLQSRMYKATEYDDSVGKFLDFQEILDTIVQYSNDFKPYTEKERSRDEWMYMIPTLSLYASLGFLAGMKNKKLEEIIDFEQESENLVTSTLTLVGTLSDLLDEHNETELLEKEVEKLKEELC